MKPILRGLVAAGVLASLFAVTPASASASAEVNPTPSTSAAPSLSANTVFAHEVVPGTWTGQCEAGRYFFTIDMYTADWYDLPVPYEGVVDYYSGTVGNFDDPGYPGGSILIEQYNWEYDTGFAYPPFEGGYSAHSDDYGIIQGNLPGGSFGVGPTLYAGRWTNPALDLDVVGHQLITFTPDGSSSLRCHIIFAWGYEEYWH
ncbi:hypothetical protein [Allonocardiopsis opalescens]|nr:hypothetical protein [Allonocardiopsis opalescens]